ncbi:helix-turn-helix transcriptional regulator [Amycolatopsis taiwanensis]|uniref:helix-turn-helix transcriptional regulator n=1 Tax=Amycolatopsis taiwanensis TaxID=342230 RepID=UPI0004B438FF|nr:LuxR C-terminal-related transcriptional regulator [Amycolatopsis taiwanensis]
MRGPAPSAAPDSRWRIPHGKIVAPRVPTTFVRRKPLRDLLDQAVATPVTTICAPAGYGKTLLLADWIETTGESDKAWVSLDAADGEPSRFFAGVLGAIRECAAVPDGHRLRDLVVPGDGDLTGFVAELGDAFDTLPGRLCLVLDDVQEISGTRTLHGVEMLIRHQPAALRLVLSSRFDPPLPLARLRVQGRLREIRAHHLRFCVEDADKLLEATGVSLTNDQLSRLIAQTDGWVAGLRLAARSLREVADIDAFLADFAADDRAVADFLMGEVLARLPEATREFLRVISVCEEVSPLLAEVLSGRDDAGAVLDALERDSSLVMGTGRDRHWYRMHPLLRAYLRSDLDRQQPGLAANLHRVAASWFAAEQPRKALHHAMRADDRDTVRELVRQHGLALLLSGDHLLVRQALSAIGVNRSVDEGWLALISALTHLEAGEFTAAGANLVKAGRACEVTPLLRLVTSTYALARGHSAQVELGNPASVAPTRPDLPARVGPGLEAWARLATGWALIEAGEPDRARTQLDAAQRLAGRPDLDYLAMHCRTAQGAVHWTAGRYTAMAAACAESVAIADRHGWRRSPWLAIGHVMLGYARLLRLDPAGAREQAAQAWAVLDRASDPRLRYLSRAVEGAALFDTGRREAGLRLLRSARHELADVALMPELAVTAALIEYRSALLLGQETTAREVFQWAKQRADFPAELSLMIAWARFARGETGSAERALEPVLDASVRTTRLEGWLLKSAMAISSGRRTIARSALDNAVWLAEPETVMRPFAQADPAARQLLVEQIGGFGGCDAFATTVRRALSDMDGERSASTLTARENAVLGRLSLQRSLDEVAVDLSVSVNTIKTHVRAIYAKLGVNNRRAAVAAARERGLA